MAQRMQWEYPEVVKLLGEYWLSTNDPSVINIYEVDRYELIMEMRATWDDAFDINVFSATTAEEEMEWIKKAMGQEVNNKYFIKRNNAREYAFGKINMELGNQK